MLLLRRSRAARRMGDRPDQQTARQAGPVGRPAHPLGVAAARPPNADTFATGPAAGTPANNASGHPANDAPRSRPSRPGPTQCPQTCRPIAGSAHRPPPTSPPPPATRATNVTRPSHNTRRPIHPLNAPAPNLTTTHHDLAAGSTITPRHGPSPPMTETPVGAEARSGIGYPAYVLAWQVILMQPLHTVSRPASRTPRRRRFNSALPAGQDSQIRCSSPFRSRGRHFGRQVFEEVLVGVVRERGETAADGERPRSRSRTAGNGTEAASQLWSGTVTGPDCVRQT